MIYKHMNCEKDRRNQYMITTPFLDAESWQPHSLFYNDTGH